MLSLLCLALGAVAVVDLAVADVHASAYFAAALAVIGIGLLIGAWLGRARWLILLGIALSAALAISSAVEADRFDDYRRGSPVVWQPASVAELQTDYRLDFGEATLDLRDVDFAASPTPVNLSVAVNVGRLRVLLPPTVDVDLTANIDAGDAFVLGEQWGGFGSPTRRVQDAGADGAGGGSLVLDARIDFGNLEVER